jgi:hypothetical protein
MYFTHMIIFLYAISPLFVYSAPQPHLPQRHGRECPPFSGNFTISRYQLYPENADFNFNACELYLGIVWNASLGIYDPYTNEIDVVEFEGITHDPQWHIGGVQTNPRTNLLSILVNYWPTLLTGGKDVSGTNFIMLYNPTTRELLYKHNLSTITHNRFGGFQDLEHDPENNVYIVGTQPSSILKVNSKGTKIETWYLNDYPVLNTTIAGFTGLASTGWLLLASDRASGSLYRLNMHAPRGNPQPILVTPPYKIENPDAIQLPPRYKGTVLLVAEVFKGVSVFRDKRGTWEKAEYLGRVEWTHPIVVVTAPVQVGDAIYMNLLPFGSGVDGGAGNETNFLYFDITAQLEALLQK